MATKMDFTYLNYQESIRVINFSTAVAGPIIDAKGYIVAFVSVHGTRFDKGFPASVAKSILAGCVLADKSEAQSKKL